MACNNNCDCNTNCNCNDTTITTPCSYTNCEPGNERCVSITCTECVSYCGTSFQVENNGNLLKVASGERLDSILQKFAIAIANGFGECVADNVHHAPYNIYASNVTKTSAVIIWTDESSETVSLSIQYDTVINPSGWLPATDPDLSSGVFTYTINNLTPGTEYKVKIVSKDSNLNVCESVQILIKTPLT